MVYCFSPAMRLLSICCTSNPLLQSAVLPRPASCQNQSLRLWANPLAESFRRGVRPNTHSNSVLCLATTCFPSFLIIRDRTGNTEYFRVRISDIEGFLNLLPGHKFIHPCCGVTTSLFKFNPCGVIKILSTAGAEIPLILPHYPHVGDPDLRFSLVIHCGKSNILFLPKDIQTVL